METKIILTEEVSILDVLKTNNGLQAIKNEFAKVVEFSSKLEITDFEDKKQIEIVKSSKQGYVTTRNTIKRAFKSKRDINTEENRLNLEAEREVLAVMEKEENRLGEMLEKAELMKLRKENLSKLQDRVDSLKKYDFVEDNEVLLNMTEKEFGVLLQNKREVFLQIQEQKIKAEQEKIAREKEIEEAKKQARIEAEKEAYRLAEIEKERVEKEKEEAEQKRLRDLENARIEKENEISRIKKEQEEKELAEKKKREDEEQARIEAEKEAYRLAEIEKERVEKEKEEAEQKRLRDLENARIEKENEISRIKKEQEEKELAEKKKREDEEQARIEAENLEKNNQARLEKEKAYITYRDSIDFDKFEKEEGKIVFYKKVGEFLID